MTTFTVTSKNRNAAKRLLSTWNAAADVRTWTLSQLMAGLQRAINEDLITPAGVQRALGADSKKRDSHNGGNGQSSNDETDETRGNGNESESDAGNGDAESESAGDASTPPMGSEMGEDKGEDEGKQDEKSDAQKDAESVAEMSGESDANDSRETRNENYGNEECENSYADLDGEAIQEAYDKGYDNAAQENESADESDSDDNDDEDRAKASDDEADEESENESESDDENAEDDAQDDDEKEHEHEMLKTIKKYIRAGLNVALVGPAGSGKSYLSQQVARHLGLDFYTNGAMMSKYDLIGYKDANGTYHGTPAYDAYTEGGLHCFDEFDASAPDAAVSFNGMTDDQGFFTFPCGQKAKHADYVAIACMNTFGNGATADYVGRYKQDAASMTRFVKVFIDYDDTIERRVGDADIVDRVQNVRAACELLGIRHIASTRMIIQATQARKAKANKTEIDRDIIFSGLDKDAITQIKAAIKGDK